MLSPPRHPTPRSNRSARFIQRAALSVLLLANSTAGAPNEEGEKTASVIPQRLSARIGGMLGTTYRVELKGETLLYSSERGRDKVEAVEIVPTRAQWAEFRSDLDTIKVWRWEASHVNERVLDGTHWGFEIEYSDRSLKAVGSNCYPRNDGRPNGRPETTAAFRRYLAAVEKLLGGRKFR